MLKKFWNRPITWGDSIIAAGISMGVSLVIAKAGWWMMTKDAREEAKKEKHIHRIDSDAVKEEDFEN